ncbi:MAG: hypothetical protein KAY32_09785 [Candidatus Eisenbacteria sp.]|nr:hypothetical protein [Candidatus Eisenbacteria bacterium]
MRKIHANPIRVFMGAFILAACLPTLVLAESHVVEVRGYGADRRLALRDAFRAAVEQGLGVTVQAKSEVERFRLVMDIILTKSQGFVENYEVLFENPNSSMGFEIALRATVTKGRISKLENLKTLIELMGNPGVMVVVVPSPGEPRVGGNLLAGEITASLQRAGYRIVRPRSAMPRDLADGLDAAAAEGVDVLVLGELHSVVTGRVGNSQFPIISSRSQLSIQVVIVETGQVVYTFQSSEGRGSANTEDGSIKKAIQAYCDDVGQDLLWNMAPAIGPPYQVELVVSGANCGELTSLETHIIGSGEVETLALQDCAQGIARYQARIACKSADFVRALTRRQKSRFGVVALSRGHIELEHNE